MSWSIRQKSWPRFWVESRPCRDGQPALSEVEGSRPSRRASPPASPPRQASAPLGVLDCDYLVAIIFALEPRRATIATADDHMKTCPAPESRNLGLQNASNGHPGECQDPVCGASASRTSSAFILSLSYVHEGNTHSGASRPQRLFARGTPERPRSGQSSRASCRDVGASHPRTSAANQSDGLLRYTRPSSR